MSARIASGGPSVQAAFNVRARQTIDGVFSHPTIAEAHVFVASPYGSAYEARGEYQGRSAQAPPVTFRFLTDCTPCHTVGGSGTSLGVTADPCPPTSLGERFAS